MGQFKQVQKGKEQPKVAQKATFQQPTKQAQKTQVQPSKASSKR
jgi:hypothetical protein